MKVNYIRISTASQKVDRQMKEGEKMYIDICSGTIPFAERKEGKKLLSNKSITQVQVQSVDRLGRNMRDILDTWETLTKRKVDIYIEDQGLHTMIDGKPNPTATMILQIMATIAEFEREQTLERTRQGIAAAKAKDRFLPPEQRSFQGRKKGTKEPLSKVKEKHKEKIEVVNSLIAQGKSLTSICKEYGYNRQTIYQLINKGLINNKKGEMQE